MVAIHMCTKNVDAIVPDISLLKNYLISLLEFPYGVEWYICTFSHRRVPKTVLGTVAIYRTNWCHFVYFYCEKK